MTLAVNYIVRPPTMQDLAAVVDLFNTCSTLLIGSPDASVEETRSEWLLPGFDLEKSARLVTAVDGQVVGYVEVWDIEEVPARIWVWGRVHPDHEGQGIGSHLMTWAEARARQAIDRVPADIRVFMQSGTVNGYEPAQNLLAGQGMEIVRHFQIMMTQLDSPPPEPTLPAGVTIRAMIPDQDERATIEALRDAFKDHWGYIEEPFETEYARWRYFMSQDEAFDPSLWFLAVENDDIVGVSLCRLKSMEDADTGWIERLGVRRPWRQKGIALALLQHSFCELYRRGQKRIALGIDAESVAAPARLFTKAGMMVARQFDFYEKELRHGRELRNDAPPANG